MSFTTEIKKELCELNITKKCCLKAELCSIICFGAHIRSNCLVVRTENEIFAQHISSLTKALFQVPALIIKKATPGLLEVQIADQKNLTKVLEYFELIKNAHDMKNFVSFRLPDFTTKKDCCAQAVLRGAFLTTGSCSEPEKRYHLEITTNHYMLGKDFLKIIESLGISAKSITRRSSFVIYLKSADYIHDILGYSGAMKAVLRLEETRVTKDFKNNINRTTNFEYANLSKALDAGNQQADAIRKIRDTIGFSSLDDNLKELAQLRLERPDATLKELSQLLSEPISKSGINHRLKKLVDISDSIKTRKKI